MQKKIAMEATLLCLCKDLRSGKYKRPTSGQDGWGSSDSSDEDIPPGPSNAPLTVNGGLSMMEESFIKALPSCFPIDLGFNVTKVSSDICFCPCTQPVQPWREAHKLICDDCSSKRKMFKPNGLMDHLRDMGRNCFYHKCVGLQLTSSR
jgi:hypothetical protein